MFEQLTNWDREYANGDFVVGSDAMITQWDTDAQACRDSLGERVAQHAYGDAPRQVLDLIQPQASAGDVKGLAVFIHGGYWLRLDKNSFTHLARGPLARGWAVAIPSYRLASNADSAGIGSCVEDVRAAVAYAAALVEGPIRVAGHSAGGQLTSMLAYRDEPWAGWLEHLVSISGVHDLRPLLRTSMRELLKLSEQDARALSPVLLEPAAKVPVTAWVGSSERPEFLRQTRQLVDNWVGLGMAMQQVVERGKHHFDVIDGLADAASPLTRCWLGELPTDITP